MLKWFQRDKRSGGPDFSAVDSQEKAEELHRQGVLHKLLLMPADFVGRRFRRMLFLCPSGLSNSRRTSIWVSLERSLKKVR